MESTPVPNAVEIREDETVRILSGFSGERTRSEKDGRFNNGDSEEGDMGL